VEGVLGGDKQYPQGQKRTAKKGNNTKLGNKGLPEKETGTGQNKRKNGGSLSGPDFL